MNRDEILNKSRLENKEFDERELLIRRKATQIAKAIGVAVAFLLVLVDAIWIGDSRIGFTALTIAFGMNAVESWIVYAGTRKKTELVSSLFDTIFCVASVIRLILFFL